MHFERKIQYIKDQSNEYKYNIKMGWKFEFLNKASKGDKKKSKKTLYRVKQC